MKPVAISQENLVCLKRTLKASAKPLTKPCVVASDLETGLVQLLDAHGIPRLLMSQDTFLQMTEGELV